jgi:hypothetical protein
MSSGRAVVTLLVLLPAACTRGPAAAPSPSPAAADSGRSLPSPMPDVVARVNGQPILLHQILPMAKAELDRLKDAERERKKPEVLRHALQRYVDRELLMQEALARGVAADSSQVDWAYDQMRREHPDEEAWEGFLAEQGMDPSSFRKELRTQLTVAALLDREMAEAAKRDAGSTPRPSAREEVQAVLLARLRAKARIEILL